MQTQNAQTTLDVKSDLLRIIKLVQEIQFVISLLSYPALFY